VTAKTKKILITGGTGSLGKALIKQIKKIGWKIIVYSRDEGKQALAFGSDPEIIRVIGDVRDLTKLDTTMRLHKPDYVIHAAALKRVDDMEFHPDECIKTNVLGSQNVATAALSNNVKKCILISTDKACQPINVYGSSKFIAERIFTNFDYNSSSTIFASVRYGNVIASRGSFIPLWMEKVKNNEEIPITSFECSRFLFTLDDAVFTVLNSLVKAQGGEVFIPKISSYNLETVLKSVKSLVGVNETKTVINGMRPGEKIHEDMLAKTELPFTYEIDEDLLVVIPQYTNKVHSYDNKYEGKEFNSSLHLDGDVENLKEIIEEGIGIEG
jgi:UDP-N-acetylglucosamine 4,6-dehydratase/5-epimerase